VTLLFFSFFPPRALSVSGVFFFFFLAFYPINFSKKLDD